MRYILNYEKLQTGDIILQSGKKLHSKAIKIYTKSNFSHAMICVEQMSIIHAEKKGIFSLNPQRIIVQNKDDLKVLRLNKSLSVFEKEKIATFLRMQVGSIYSVKEALLVIQLNQTNNHAKNEYQFCSRLVAQAYNEINYTLVSNIDFCSPEDINQSKFLVEVENIVREASQEDIEFSKTKNAVYENQKSMYDWLNKTRDLADKKYKINIHKINDVDEFLIQHPLEDNEICNYVEQSGYLKNFEMDIQNNPHMYDKQKFINKFHDLHIDILEAIIGEFQKEPDIIARQLQNYKIAIFNYQNTRLKFHQIHSELYKNILSIVMSRLLILFEVYGEFLHKDSIQNNQIFALIYSYLQLLADEGIEKYNIRYE